MTLIRKINNAKITSIVIASILLIGSISVAPSFAHKLNTDVDLVFDNPTPTEGDIVALTGTVTTSDTPAQNVQNPFHAAINPVTDGIGKIEQGINMDDSPASSCDPYDWTELSSAAVDSNGQFSYNFNTAGYGGQTLVFRTHYITPGGSHVPATAQSDCEELEIALAEEDGCDETGQLCKTVVITEEIDDGVITVNELIQYDFTINLTNNDGQSWFYVKLFDHGFGGDLAVGDGPVDPDDPRDVDFMVVDNLDCELTQTGNTDKEKLDCIVDSNATADAIDPTGDEELIDGESATVEVTAYTDFNPGQAKKDNPKREYTSCGIHSPNEGAVVEYFLEGEDPEVDEPHILATPAIYVEVYDFADLSGDCDEDGLLDGDDPDPFVFNDEDEDGVGDGNDLCPFDLDLGNGFDEFGCAIQDP